MHNNLHDDNINDSCHKSVVVRYKEKQGEIMKNLQSQRTDKMIRDAFIALLKQNNFKDITVTQIAQKAMINRQTFYNYYLDKYDLADQLTEKALKMVEKLIDQRWQSIDDQVSLIDFIKISQNDQHALFNQILSEERDLFLTMLNLQVDSQSLRQKLQQMLKKELQVKLSPEPQPFVLDLLSGICVVIMENNLLRGQVPSQKEIEQFRELFLKITG